ncbi:uncharacterized protein Z520_03896 [Fonsecaea multimorphosa CBS 102226]|uniref:PHD-type domain-containing protein n=1 Tax=Fonsecaea multimorphosa CBS 102226 TaxID=1442371 RepID=A0A0D2HE95_9EURO|nr:uncharacterized protein Z520_03896 [Fonsecaea multimorphosa CBS 102226]KIY00211.1 hypothetical protein Z520_03896 [Fonsecaea multimorphosa CBS 102226]OAL27404.1 hypothetical protein AYO22_03679 [Fonsecaea multimorphosa]
MAFALSELLNPEPATDPISAGGAHVNAESHGMDTAEPPSAYFAPELFQPSDDAPHHQDTLPSGAQNNDLPMDDVSLFKESEHMVGLDGSNDEDHIKQEAMDIGYPPLDEESNIAVDSSLMDMVEENLYAEDAPAKATPEKTPKQRKHPGKSRKADPEAPPRSSIHSSKNEGQHTDRRYLCYLCNKLFTRRRSVRDHISKIHNTKTWEPVRSLEIIVEPSTGEPLEPLDDIIARGPPPPPPKLSKAEKAKRTAKRDEEGEDDDEELHPGDIGEEEEEKKQDDEEEILYVAQPVVDSSLLPTGTASTLKRVPSIAGSRASSAEPFVTPAPLAGKKRPAPDDPAKLLSAAARKKGTAKVKSTSNKKARLSESGQSPPAGRSNFRSPSATPSTNHLKLGPSKLKTQTSAASVKSSPTPGSSRAASREIGSPSPSFADTSSSSNDDGEVFCICRKGDNHTWMIACDGGCDEWFHGNCVNIKERDGELIDKYICPTCTKPGLQTTWKRMCRRKDCRKPARVTQVPPSKYCSDACGRMFFVELVQRGDPQAQTSKDGQYIIEGPPLKKHRKKQKRREKPAKQLLNLVNGVDPDSRLATPAYSDEEKTEYETDSSLDDDMLPNRGSALRAGEIKALIEKCKDIEQLKALGRKPDTPPREIDINMADADSKPTAPPDLEYDDLETSKMANITDEKQRLKVRYDMLLAREKFLELVKARSSTIVEEFRKTHPKMKDLCGFDPRMSWSDEEFATWYDHNGGRAIIDAGAEGRIGPPEEVPNDEGSTKLPNGDAAHSQSPVVNEEEEENDNMPKKGGVCIKNRCPRHRNWAKGQLAEVRFEQDLVRRAIQRCEAQEGEIRGRAVVRAWEKRG